MLALVMCLSVSVMFSSCGEDDNTNDSDGNGTQSTREDQNRDIVLAENGETKYTLIYSNTAENAVVSAVKAFQSVFEAKTGVKLSYDLDSKKGTDYEIIIGNTKRDESKAVEESVGYLEYTMELVGNKIIIFGYTAMGISKCLNTLGNKLTVKDGVCTYNGENNISGVEHEPFSHVPKYEGGNIQGFYNCDDDVYQLSINKTDAEDYYKFIAKLEPAGYTLYASNEIGDCRFATYTKDNEQVHVAFYPALGQCKIFAEETSYLPATEAENYTRVVTSSVMMPENDYRGLGIVFQIADGSFIIVDGGDTDSSGDPQGQVPRNLYNLLNQYKVGDKIKISAWIFTHAHDDHMTGALSFLETYHDKVEVDLFAYNFPTYEALKDAKDGPKSESAHKNYEQTLKGLRNKYYTDAQIFKFHTGQELKICDATVEFYYTQEDYYPLKFPYGNHTSAGFIVDIGGTRTLVLGDMEVECNERMAKAYGTAVDCDILSPAHHGLNGGTLTLYNLMTPDICLWGTIKDKFDRTEYNGIRSVRGYEHSMYLITNVKTHYTYEEPVRVELPLKS